MKDKTRKKEINHGNKDDSEDNDGHRLRRNEYKLDANDYNINTSINMTGFHSKLQYEDIPKRVPVPKGDNGFEIDSLSFCPESDWLRLIRLPGIIVFGMLAGYAVGVFGYNFLWLLPIAHVVCYVFMGRVSAYKRSLHNLLKRKIETINNDNGANEDIGETVEWLNYIIRKTWEVGEEGVSAHIFAAVNDALAEKRPQMLTSLRLRELTLGTRPPVVSRVRHVETEEGMCLEFAIEFTPVQTDRDILAYFGEERRHWNTCIELVATIGFMTLPVLVRNFVFTGVFRAELVLGRRLPFVERVRLCALEKPTVDFELYPLKMPDVMDLPYLARAIRGAVDMAMETRLVAPRHVEIAVRPLTGRPTRVVGVAHVFVGGAKTRDEQTSWVELTVNRETVGKTKTRTGAYPIFDECFWVEVLGAADNVAVCSPEICDVCKSDATDSGSCVTNKANSDPTVVPLLSLSHPIEVTLVSGTARFYGQIHSTRDWHAEQLHCGGGEAKRFVDVSMQLFPAVSLKTRHAVFVMTVVGVTGLRAVGAAPTQLYSTHCRVTVERRNAPPDSSPEYEFETPRSFSTCDPLYNQTCRFLLREYNRFVLCLRILSETDGEEIGRVEMSVAGINDGTMRCSLTGADSGELELEFRVHHVDLKGICYLEGLGKDMQVTEMDASADTNALPMVFPGGYIARRVESPVTTHLGLFHDMNNRLRPVDYTRAYEVALVSIDTDGSFYIVVETRYMSWKSPCFSSVLPVAATLVVVLTQHETCVRLRLFQMLERGDVLLDEKPYDFVIPRVQFAYVALSLVSRPCSIERVIGTTDTSPASKVVQFVLTNITETKAELNGAKDDYGVGIVRTTGENDRNVYDRSEDLILEIATDYGTIVRNLSVLCTVVCGSRPPVCRLRRRDEQQDTFATLATFVLPLHTVAEPFQLSSTLLADLNVDVRRCSVDYFERSTAGSLELYFIKVVGVPPACNPYLKIYCNDEKIHKTGKKINETNPVFNETCKITVDRDIDVVSCFLNDHSSIANSRIIAYLDIPLLNIKPGYFKYSIQLKDYLTNTDSNIFLDFIACFVPTPDASTAIL